MLNSAMQAWDNCLAKYKDGYRKASNYIQADGILADIDNMHSDNESDWITPEDVKKALLDVAIGVTIKINDMNGRTEVYGIPEKYGKDDLNNLLVTIVSGIAYKLSYKRVISNVVQETLHVIASENHYHPVVSLL